MLPIFQTHYEGTHDYVGNYRWGFMPLPGALREESREIKMIGDITACRYSGKLPVGHRRNDLISSFRLVKGEQ